jgi:hypothetical protein
VRAFKAGCPDAEFVGAIPGDRRALGQFQERRATERISGSWYILTPELLTIFKR